MCTQQMLTCRNNQVCLHGIFAYEISQVYSLLLKVFGCQTGLYVLI